MENPFIDMLPETVIDSDKEAIAKQLQQALRSEKAQAMNLNQFADYLKHLAGNNLVVPVADKLLVSDLFGSPVGRGTPTSHRQAAASQSFKEGAPRTRITQDDKEELVSAVKDFLTSESVRMADVVTHVVPLNPKFSAQNVAATVKDLVKEGYAKAAGPNKRNMTYSKK